MPDQSGYMIWNGLQEVASWLNTNDGVLALFLFMTTIFLGWISGIFSAIRRKPKIDVKMKPGPTFACTFGTGKKHYEYPIHRTGIALYLNITNVGLAATNIENIEVGYHWAIKAFGLNWLKYRIGWHWIPHPAVSLEDFQFAIGENIKGYPFWFQLSPLTGQSADTYLQVGQSPNGVVYF